MALRHRNFCANFAFGKTVFTVLNASYVDARTGAQEENMKKLNFELIKKIDYVLVLFIAIVCIALFLTEKISRYIPRKHLEPAHISVINSDDDVSSEEIKESINFLKKVDDTYIFTISTNAIKSAELSDSIYTGNGYNGLAISNSIGQSIRQSSSQIVNFMFQKGKEENKLFSSKVYIYKYELKKFRNQEIYQSSYPYPLTGHDFNIYAVIKDDSNNDKKLDSKDNISLFVSDYDGKNLHEISSSIYYLENIEQNIYLFTEYNDGKVSFFEYDGNTDKVTLIKTIEQELNEKEIKLWQ